MRVLLVSTCIYIHHLSGSTRIVSYSLASIILWHHSLELIIGGSYLCLICRSIGMESISWHRFSQIGTDTHVATELSYLRLVEFTDRTDIYSSISVFGEESDTIVLYLVPCSRDEESVCPSHRIEQHHTKS